MKGRRGEGGRGHFSESSRLFCKRARHTDQIYPGRSRSDGAGIPESLGTYLVASERHADSTPAAASTTGPVPVPAAPAAAPVAAPVAASVHSDGTHALGRFLLSTASSAFLAKAGGRAAGLVRRARRRALSLLDSISVMTSLFPRCFSAQRDPVSEPRSGGTARTAEGSIVWEVRGTPRGRRPRCRVLYLALHCL